PASGPDRFGMRRYPPFDDDVQITPLRIPRPPRGTWWVLGVIGAVIVLLLVVGPLISIGSELLWFQGLGLREVYTTRLGLQLWLFFGSLVVAFLYVILNVLIAPGAVDDPVEHVAADHEVGRRRLR